MTPEMTEQVFGLTVNEVMAYAAVANVLLVFVLVAINTYYAWHSKRQADASKEQVAAANRQADAAQKTLDLLLKQNEQQRRIDESTVGFTVEAAISAIDDWTERLNSESYDLPDFIEILPAKFNSAISCADRVERGIGGYMAAGALFVAKAETDIRIMQDKNPALFPDSPLHYSHAVETRGRLQKRASKSLSVARFKLDIARTSLRAIIEDGERRTAPYEHRRAERVA